MVYKGQRVCTCPGGVHLGEVVEGENVTRLTGQVVVFDRHLAGRDDNCNSNVYLGELRTKTKIFGKE